MDDIKISVVIPVYNAKPYIQEAVESALMQPETGEVLLIEDGSSDGSLEVCQQLANIYKNVLLFQHPDKQNHGAAASRNLGIRNASFPYVAFLDADDFYLPNRFAKAVDIFKTEQRVDGVYEAIGTVFEDENSKELFHSVGLKEITTVRYEILPEDLFKAFMRGGAGGHFHFNGFTARKEVFSEVAYFDEKLEMYEDTMLMFQLSVKCRLFPGNINNPVAMRRVHSLNRITYRFADRRKTYETLSEFWELFLGWAKNNLTPEQTRWVYHKMITHIRNVDFPEYSNLEKFITSRKNMFLFAIKNPNMFREYIFWRYMFPG